MNERFLNLLIKWNDGIERGAKIRLAKELNVKHPAVFSWIAGRQIPGEANIHKMAALFGVSVQQLNNIFNRKSKNIGEGLELVTPVDTSFSAIFHAGEVIFLNDGIQTRVEKGEQMKFNVKIKDDGFVPRLQKGDIVVIDTKVQPKLNGIVFCRSKTSSRSDNSYKLLEVLGYDFGLGKAPAPKSTEVVIGTAVEVISIKKI